MVEIQTGTIAHKCVDFGKWEEREVSLNYSREWGWVVNVFGHIDHEYVCGDNEKRARYLYDNA